MIPENFITEWKAHAPWKSNAQIEQDLILSRVIVELFSNELLKEELRFRGGTALQKLYFPKAQRYSEDVDLVQKNAVPIGKVMHEIQETLNPWLGKPKWKQTKGRVTFYYRYDSEIAPMQKMKVKLEINTREHYHYDDLVEIPFSIQSRWFTGKVAASSYTLEELLGTKMRALYQRKKGRDLFDLFIALRDFPSLDKQKIIDCFTFYLDRAELKVSRAEFEKNMWQKLNDRMFQEDISALLRDTDDYNQQSAYQTVHQNLIQLLAGVPWKQEVA